MPIRHAAVALVILALAAPAQQSIALTTGVDGHFDVPHDLALVPPTGMTVEAWITYDETTVPTGGIPFWPTICRKNNQPGVTSWFLRVGAASSSNRNLEFVVDSGSGLTFCVYNFAPGEFLNWTHVAATFDGVTLRIFANGVEVATRPTPFVHELLDLGGVFRVGNGDTINPGAETWNGMIDEVRVWPFARTAGEIQSTMNLELQTMPGKVVTFNLNGTYIDSSLGLMGTPTAANIAFSTNAPSLTPRTSVALNLGQSTSTCPRTLDSGMTCLPTVGNQDFALACTKGPTTSPFGVLVVASRAATAPAPQMFGVTVYFDPTRVLAAALLLPPTDALGNARRSLPIPNIPILAGASFAAQFGFQDSTCGPAGFTASDGLAFAIQ